jgi:hypothetical protein
MNWFREKANDFSVVSELKGVIYKHMMVALISKGSIGRFFA